MSKTVAEMKLIGSHEAKLKAFSVAGFASAGANGSAVITGFSASVDTIHSIWYTPSGASVAASFEPMGVASAVNSRGNRLRINDTNTTNGRVFGFWWDQDG